MEYPIVSIVIATYNSEKLLPRTLDAIKRQTYPKERIEILIVDGGSTDKTIRIADSYGCVILYNDKTEPINAKMIGLRHATGKYMITLDHDEVIENRQSIARKVVALQAHPECKVALCSGYKRPSNYPLLNEYISEFGDPFSLFIYGFPKGDGFLEKTMKRSYVVKEIGEKEGYFVFSFDHMRKEPIFELCCAGTMIDRDFFCKIPGVLEDSSIMVHLFYVMLEQGVNEVVMLKEDALVHYSVDSLKAYFPKLKWRICNNVHFPDMSKSGFNGRQNFQRSTRYKKYLFVPYTLSCVCPIVQGAYLALSRKNVIYLAHIIFCWYVLWEICHQYSLKLIHRSPRLTSYDGKKEIE